MKEKPLLALNLLWAALAIGAFFAGSIFTKSRMSRADAAGAGGEVERPGRPTAIGQGTPVEPNPGGGKAPEIRMQDRSKPAGGSALREKYTKRVVVLSSTDFANLVKTDLDEAKRVFAIVEAGPAGPNGVTRQTYGGMIVSELLTRDLDLAISFSDRQSIWWNSSVDELATEVDKQRGVGGLLAWIDNIGYRSDEDGMEYKKVAARAAIGIVAKEDPERASEWVIANAGQPHVGGYTLQQIAGNVDNDPANQLEWLAELPITGKDQTEAIGGVFAGFIRSDLDAAGQWLAAQELQPMHDIAIREFASAAANFDPEGAQAWAERISDDPLRQLVLKSLASQFE